ncbi:MAG: right-handed parallel beta-helix repeat-containing protein [Candidatus Sumerlaeota bacterium]|nr:right-handed parallel beta-helix repeat-containing protein [Candidatus Sumerlaeota bacterium]
MNTVVRVGRVRFSLWSFSCVMAVLAVAAFPPATALATSYYYVSWTTGSDTPPGDGSAAHPWKTISHALLSAPDGVEDGPVVIRVAGGMALAYTESPTFTKGWMTVEGGYRAAGWVRDLQNYPTTVDGQGYRAGFVVSAGLAGCGLNGISILNCQAQDGAGVHAESDLLLNNCQVRDCVAQNTGGGLWTNVSLTLVDCIVTANSAGSGGGIYGTCTLTGCTVSENSAAYAGGGINGTCTLTGCTIKGNSAGWGGGGIYGTCTLTGCTVSENSAAYAGGIMNETGSITLGNCTIHNNTADFGGAIYCYGNCDLTGCTISKNSAIDGDGGGINGAPTMNNCTVTENTAGRYGGGICFIGLQTGTFEDCTITYNKANVDGGGIWAPESGTVCIMARCRVAGNAAQGQGGGFYGNVGVFDQCRISANSASAGNAGGTWGDELFLTNCVLWNNTGIAAQLAGGWVKHCTIAAPGVSSGAVGMVVGGNTVVIADSILAFEGYGISELDAASDPQQIYNNLFYSNTLGHYVDEGSTVLNTEAQIDGAGGAGGGNIAGQNPLLASPSTGDLHIQAGSPCIDTAMDLGIPVDLDGNARPFGSAPDIGAYEWGYPLPPNSPTDPDPADGATGVDLLPTLQWGAAARATQYDLWLWLSAELKPTSPTATLLTQTSYAPPAQLAPLTVYSWQVVAKNEAGQAAGDIWTFETAEAGGNNPPQQPTNDSPPDGAADVPLTPPLGCSTSGFSDPDAGDTHAASQWQVRDSGANVVFDSGIDSADLVWCSIPPGVLQYGQTYSWWVRHQDNHLAWSPWSSPTTFTTLSAPSRPAPPQGLIAVGGATAIDLDWDPNGEADLLGYNVYGQLVGAPSWTLLTPTPIPNTEFTHPGLTAGDTWQYHVTAVNTGGAESDPSVGASATVGADIAAWTPDVHGAQATTISIPVNLTAVTGITGRAGDVWLRFPSDLLEFQDAVPTVLTEGWVVETNVVGNLVKMIVVAGDPGNAFDMVGVGWIVELKFKVIGAIPGASGPLSFDIVKLYDRNIQPVTVDYSDTSTFTVDPQYILGDLNGDEAVDSADVAIAMDIAVGRTIPTPLQMMAGDINGDKEIDSADVALIIDIALGRPITPTTLEAGDKRERRRLGLGDLALHYTVQVGSAQGVRGQTVDVPITLNDATNFSGCDLALNYDSAHLTFVGANLGGLVSGADGWRIESLAAGNSVALSAAGTMLPSGSGELLVLHFTIGNDAGGFYPLSATRSKLAGRYGEDLAWRNEVISQNGLVTVLAPAPGAASLGPVTDEGSGSLGFSWTDSNQPPAQYLAFAYDFYKKEWVSKWNGAMWLPFPWYVGAGTMNLGASGAYAVWISNQYADGDWYCCNNPWVGILYSGTPHTPLGPENLTTPTLENRGGRQVRLNWGPEIYGTWMAQIAIYQNGVGWITPADGPSTYPQGAPWTFIDYGGLVYDASKASFFEGWADFTLPDAGSFVFYLNFKAWDGLSQGEFATAQILLAP